MIVAPARPLHRSRPGLRVRFALRSLASLLTGTFLLLNGLAFVHAWAATHFGPPGELLSPEAVRDMPLLEKLRLLGGVPIPRPYNRYTPTHLRLPYDTQHIPLANGEQLESWYVPHQQSRGLVIMFPGYAVAKQALLTPAAVLYEWGYSSLLVDFRGAGGSSRSDTMLGMREAEDVAASMHYAQANLPGQPLLLYGTSMGSGAILHAVAQHGVQPAALILEGTFDRLRTTARHRFTSAGLPAFPADLLLFWGSVQTGSNAFALNPIDDAAAVRCPTLLLYGEQDPWITADESWAIFDQLAAPKTLVPVPGVGHQLPYIYPAGELWKREVGAFLAGLPRS